MQTIITIIAERKHTNGVISKSESISDSQLKMLNYPLSKWFEETSQKLISALNGLNTTKNKPQRKAKRAKLGFEPIKDHLRNPDIIPSNY